MKGTLRSLLALVALTMAGLLGVATWSHAQTLTTGTISGTVNDPNGRPLSGVQITIVETGQTDVTDARGQFVITDVLPGTHTVQASLVGFQPVSAENVGVTQELTTNVTIQLRSRETIQTGTQTVVAPLVRRNVTPTLYTVTSKEEQLVRSQPNNLYQYPGALISQPGIVPDADGYPTIRGSKVDEVNYMVDGISVVNPVDNGFSTNLVTVGMDRMNVYTGGYRAELGSAIGGVVNAVVKTGASMRGQAAVEASTGSWSYSGVMYEQGDVEKNGFNWYISGNFFRTGFERNPSVEELPASADVVAKVIQPLGKKNRVVGLYSQGFERYLYTLTDPISGRNWGEPNLPQDDPFYFPGYRAEHDMTFDRKANEFVPTGAGIEQDYTPQRYAIGSLTFTHNISPSSSVSLQAYRLDHKREIHALSIANGYDYFDDVTTDVGKLDYSSQLSERFQLRIGGEYASSDNFNQIVYQPELAPLGLNVVRGSIPTRDLNAYISTTLRPSSRLTLDVGARYDSRQYRHQITEQELAHGQAGIEAADREVLENAGRNPILSALTPRAGLTYQLSPRAILKVSGGRFIQMPATLFMEQIYRPFNDQPDRDNGDSGNAYARARRKLADLDPQVSDGIDVGIEAQLNNYLGIAVTPYYRKIKNQVVRGGVTVDGAVDPNKGNAYQSLGHGDVRGIETKIQMRERKGLSGWLTYTLQRGENNSPGPQAGSTLGSLIAIPDEEHRNSYDQQHTIYLVGQYRTGNLEINPMFELGSGYPYGGEGAQYELAPGQSGEEENPVTIPVLINGKVQDPSLVNKYNTGWHRNLSITFRLYTNKQRSSYYFLQVQNLLNFDDVTSRYLLDPISGIPVGYVGGTHSYTDENGQQQTTNNGYYEYRPYSVVPPIFVLAGLRQTF